MVHEAVGGTAGTLDLALRLATPRERIGVLGAFEEPQMLDARIAMRHELLLIWVWSYVLRGTRPESAIALDLLARGALSAGPLITHRYPLTQIAEASHLADDRAGNSIRVLVMP